MVLTFDIVPGKTHEREKNRKIHQTQIKTVLKMISLESREVSFLVLAQQTYHFCLKTFRLWTLFW